MVLYLTIIYPIFSFMRLIGSVRRCWNRQVQVGVGRDAHNSTVSGVEGRGDGQAGQGWSLHCGVPLKRRRDQLSETPRREPPPHFRQHLCRELAPTSPVRLALCSHRVQVQVPGLAAVVSPQCVRQCVFRPCRDEQEGLVGARVCGCNGKRLGGRRQGDDQEPKPFGVLGLEV